MNLSTLTVISHLKGENFTHKTIKSIVEKVSGNGLTVTPGVLCEVLGKDTADRIYNELTRGGSTKTKAYEVKLDPKWDKVYHTRLKDGDPDKYNFQGILVRVYSTRIDGVIDAFDRFVRFDNKSYPDIHPIFDAKNKFEMIGVCGDTREAYSLSKLFEDHLNNFDEIQQKQQQAGQKVGQL